MLRVEAWQLTWDAKVVDPPHEDDEDVVREATPNPNDAIRLTNIRKVYTSRNLSNCSTTAKVAVKNLNFGVRNGECFGFLGALPTMQSCCARAHVRVCV